MDTKIQKKTRYGELRKYLGDIYHKLAKQKECKIEKRNLMYDHVHMLISIPSKYSVTQIVGFIKGQSAISIARIYLGRRKNLTGQSFWARGYHVSTVGRDEKNTKVYSSSRTRR